MHREMWDRRDGPGGGQYPSRDNGGFAGQGQPSFPQQGYGPPEQWGGQGEFRGNNNPFASQYQSQAGQQQYQQQSGGYPSHPQQQEGGGYSSFPSQQPSHFNQYYDQPPQGYGQMNQPDQGYMSQQVLENSFFSQMHDHRHTSVRR